MKALFTGFKPNYLVLVFLYSILFLSPKHLKNWRIYISTTACTLSLWLVDGISQFIAGMVPFNTSFALNLRALINIPLSMIMITLYDHFNLEEMGWQNCLLMAVFCRTVIAFGNLIQTFKIFALLYQPDLLMLRLFEHIDLSVLISALILILVRCFVLKRRINPVEQPLPLIILIFFASLFLSSVSDIYSVMCSVNPEGTFIYSRILIYGGILLLALLYMVLQQNIAEAQKKEQEILQKNLEVYADRIELLTNQDYGVIRFKHDIRYHLDMINTYINQEDLKGAQIYLRKTTGQLDKSNQEISVTENMTVNAVVNYVKTGNPEIRIDTDMAVADEPGINSIDLGILLLNILEIQIKLIKENDLQKNIILKLVRQEGMLLVKSEIQIPKTDISSIINPFDLNTIKSVVHKYHGSFVEPENPCSMKIMLICTD